MQASPSSDVTVRVNRLVDTITYVLFQYVARGLFEEDRLAFTLQMTFQILLTMKLVDPSDLDFFLRFPVGLVLEECPVKFISSTTWAIIKG